MEGFPGNTKGWVLLQKEDVQPITCLLQGGRGMGEQTKAALCHVVPQALDSRVFSVFFVLLCEHIA